MGLTHGTRFVTLWEIMEKHFKPFASKISRELVSLASHEERMGNLPPGADVRGEDLWSIQFIAQILMGVCDELSLPISRRKVGVLALMTNEKLIEVPPKCGLLSGKISDFVDTMIAELRGIMFFPVESKMQRFTSAEPLFGPNVENYFKNASNDISEAGKCFALTRWTACVFHLMRAMEVAMKAVWKTLGIPPPSLSDSWGKMISQLDDELAKNKSDRNALWVSEETFFSEAVADLRAIKRAWRDPTMHVEKDYDEEQAEKVFEAVRGFMGDLAKRLDQDGNMH